MQSFKLVLSNKTTLGGLSNIPLPSHASPENRPLIVGLHGGSYSAKYFDVDDNHTASTLSNALGVPFVAINRPGYKDTTSILPIPTGSSYPQEYGACLHHYILPALWAEFGSPNGCNCLLLLCHSLGTTGAVIAGGLHAKEPAKYPLGGIITSGFGSQIAEPPYRPSDDPNAVLPTTVTFPPEVKDQMMLPPGTADPAVYKYTVELNNEVLFEEIACLEDWNMGWKGWAAVVKVPVMVCITSEDVIWRGTQHNVQEFGRAFTGSERVDSSFIPGAPHNVEMSYWAAGWYARSFGFAVECAASFAVAKKA